MSKGDMRHVNRSDFKLVPRTYNDKMKWESMIEHGGPEYFRAETVNGSAVWAGTGWNEVWNGDRPQLPPDPTHPAGRSNRSGE